MVDLMFIKILRTYNVHIYTDGWLNAHKVTAICKFNCAIINDYTSLSEKKQLGCSCQDSSNTQDI